MATEKRLIDANVYKASLTKWKEDAWKHNERHDAMLIADCLSELELMSTVDAVEVVRCKDCRHYYPDTLSCRKLICCANWYPEDFCSYGERKDG